MSSKLRENLRKKLNNKLINKIRKNSISNTTSTNNTNSDNIIKSSFNKNTKTKRINQALKEDDFESLQKINPSYIYKPYMVALIIKNNAVNCLEQLCRYDDKVQKETSHFINRLIGDKETVQEELYDFIVETIRKKNDYVFNLIISLSEMTPIKWSMYMSVLRKAGTNPSEKILDSLVHSEVFLESIRFNINDLEKEPIGILNMMESIMFIALGAENADNYWKRLEDYYNTYEYKLIIDKYIDYIINILKFPIYKLYKNLWCKPETIIFLLEKIKNSDKHDINYNINHINIIYELEWQKLCIHSPISVFVFCLRSNIAKDKVKTINKEKWPVERLEVLKRLKM